MKEYFHSVVLDKDKCNGCTNCMRRCPTEAIRIRDKKAVISAERCIDCGECIRVCPYHAQNALTDELDELKRFKFNIAIPAMSLYGQFDLDTDMNNVFNSLRKLGFDYIYDEGYAADIVTEIIKKIIKDNTVPKPMISSLCPAILRLIQARFPSLIDNIIKIESPMEIAARMARKEVMEKFGLKNEEIGVFYIAQCPAKVASIKEPIGLVKSNLDGAISIKKVYGDIMRNVKSKTEVEDYAKASSKGIGWARVGGQSQAIGVENYIAVDGIENVIKVLEEMELGKLNNIDYFEGLACIGGCVGGPLNVENPFIAKNRIRRLSKSDIEMEMPNLQYVSELYDSGMVSLTEEIKPTRVMQLDINMQKAIEKMEKIDKIVNVLPGLDCGSCGAPTCYALAEDIVLGKAKPEDCHFIASRNIKIDN